ncbi:MAG: hypothetical protein KDB82_03940 [Planctomycetes bacterium]|nr:hypothetical protein [Planctomycetota bacterium]
MNRLVLICAICVLFASACLAGALSVDQCKLLDESLQHLVDPVGKVRVRQAPAGGYLGEVALWADPPSGQGVRVAYHLDRYPFALATPDAACVDFQRECEALLDSFRKDENATSYTMHETAAGRTGNATPMMLAAWLYRLGHEETAAAMLKYAFYGNDFDAAPRYLRRDLAWRYFSGAVNAYIYGHDSTALGYVRCMQQRYPEEMESFGTSGAALLAELQRRKDAGTADRYAAGGLGDDSTPQYPNGFETWTTSRKVEWLIDSLENVDRRQWSQPGGVDLANDWRVQGLVEIGDPAVPALIDTIEFDKRLTRSMHYWRDFAQSRYILSVREAALVAVMSILQLNLFEAHYTGDNFTSHGAGAAKQVAAKLREYWATWGALSFPERMMTLLQSPDTDADKLLDASVALAFPGGRQAYGTTIWGSNWIEFRTKRPNPAVERFSNPTAAEAILSAMIDHSHSFKDANSAERIAVEEAYVQCLTALGDKRIVEELNDGYHHFDHLRWKRLMATAAYDLGDGTCLGEYLQGVLDGSIELHGFVDRREAAFSHEAAGILLLLGRVDLAPARELRLELLNHTSPLYRPMRDILLRRLSMWRSSFADSTFALDFLASMLNDTSSRKGSKWSVDSDVVWIQESGETDADNLPESLSGPELRKRKAAARVCDLAGYYLNRYVAGLPETHPLARDQEDRLRRMRLAFDRLRPAMRRISFEEGIALGNPGQFKWVVAPHPLSVAAGAGDVEAGRAIFSLPASSTADSAALPLGAELKDGTPVLVLQKETDLFGETWYGVVSLHEVQRVPASRLKNFYNLPAN